MSPVVPKILFEDNHLLVVEKPVNTPSQADESRDPDLLSILKNDLKYRYEKPGQVYLGLVHRLDRPVGGVMIFAKTSKAAARLSAQIRNGEFKKTYRAVVYGILQKKKDTLRHFLLKDSKANKVAVVDASVAGAKEAVLDYEIIHTADGLSLVQIHLQTGRSHQIRVQFAAIGHPLFGDQKYGIGYSKPGQQIALWSTQICCKHPTQNEDITFQSLPSNEFPWSLF
ncbi:MAG TPA: RNA pseudouridine synthase [Firmicutes bacterium]|jgi:23S rRNA pseudouridine1911/1915/1917 synthase|nr:RNA pseudouridine synthase [Bacillota bacterium]